MIRRPFLLLFLPLVLSGQFACSRGPEAPGSTTTPGTAESGKNPASTDPSRPAGSPGSASNVAPGEEQKSQAKVDPTQFPDVVARVGGDSISRTDLLNAAQQAVAQSAQAGGHPPAMTIDFFHEVLSSLVVRQLLYRDAKSQGITANETEVTDRIGQLKKNFPDAKKFAEALSAQGLTEKALADNARIILSVDRYVAQKFASGIQVPEAEIRSFYDAHPDDMRVAERRRVRHILIRPEGQEPAAKEKAKKLAEDLLARIKKGEDFGTLAGQYSADPGSKSSGGEMPPIGRGETVPPFERAAWELQKGQVSGVVESPFGFHLIQLMDILPSSVVPYDQVRGRLEQFLRQRDLKQAVRAHADALRAKTKVEVLI